MKNEITLNGLQPGGNTLTILEGKALEEKYPVQIKLNGRIDTVSSFLLGRSEGYGFQNVDRNRAIVIVDKEELYIKLLLDPQNAFGTEVTGALEISPELLVFHINESKTYKREELVQLLRFNRLAFDDKDQHEKILKAYMSFSAQTATDLKAEHDMRGNKAAAINKTVSTNIPTDFILLVPIFKGKDARRFRVEICLDVTDGSARFWFESTELHELMETDRDIIFNEELKSCDGFVIINK